MKNLPLNKEIILVRLNGIEGELIELTKLRKLSQKEFKEGDGFKIATYHLHRALEGVFNIGSHILSRLPGAQAHDYKEIARKLGEYHILDRSFTETKLVEMAGYRNRLVHFYAEVSPEELFKVIHENLGDFEIFLGAIKKALEAPESFGLSVE